MKSRGLCISTSSAALLRALGSGPLLDAAQGQLAPLRAGRACACRAGPPAGHLVVAEIFEEPSATWTMPGRVMVAIGRFLIGLIAPSRTTRHGRVEDRSSISTNDGTTSTSVVLRTTDA